MAMAVAELTARYPFLAAFSRRPGALGCRGLTKKKAIRE
jgi:hypothetical protein